MAESSENSLGRIIWQTSMQMENSGVVPALRDTFTSDRWETEQENQGLIKYTQYVNDGIAVGDVTRKINEVEKVDFGWLAVPKFVCFTNCTPEGTVPTSIYIGTESENAAWTIAQSDKIPYPLWYLGNLSSEEYNAISSALGSDIMGSLTYSAASSWAADNGAKECFEVPPGMTIGPIIVPEGVDFWAYLAKSGEASDEDKGDGSYEQNAEYGAILVTEAYDS